MYMNHSSTFVVMSVKLNPDESCLLFSFLQPREAFAPAFSTNALWLTVWSQIIVSFACDSALEL